MKTARLVPHPATPPAMVRGVEVRARSGDDDPDTLLIDYVVTGAAALLVPRPTAAVRTDGLWRSTCFEAFVQRPGARSYWEINLSPSGAWAAYAFDDRRHGMRDQDMWLDPASEVADDGDRFTLAARIDLTRFASPPLRLGLSAVIEERDGTKSFWALGHGDPDKPDFHDPACFVLELPPAPIHD